MALDDQTRSAIESLLADNRVVLFMKGTRQQPQCGFSAKTTSALDMLIPEYVTINVLDYPQVREGIKEFSNWPTIPQLYVSGELIGGSDIVLEMLQSGELGDVLGVAKPAAKTPSVTLTEKAAGAIRSAAANQPNMALQLQVDAGWNHSLSFSPPSTDAVQANTGLDIPMQLDPWSASRADGLHIDMAEELAGTRFVFENPNAPPPVQALSVQSLKDKLDRGEDLLLFDVRPAEERLQASIEGAQPWDEAANQQIEALPRETQLVFHCHLGGRSQQAAEYYRRQGFTNVHNLTGGIQAWSEEIDPEVPVY